MFWYYALGPAGYRVSYDEATNQYLLSKNSGSIYSPKLEVRDVVLRVNKLPYRVARDNNEYIIYPSIIKRKTVALICYC